MPAPVLMFHLSILQSGGIMSTVSGDLDAVHGEWGRLADHAQAWAVLHVGFEPLDLRGEEITEDRRGWIFLTSPATSVIGEISQVQRESSDHLGNRRLYRWLSKGRLKPGDAPPPQYNWVASTSRQDPELARELAAMGIHDEVSYVERERRLGRNARGRAGAFRFKALGGYSSSAGVSRVIRACPPWVLDRAVDDLPLSVRLSNNLAREGVLIVRDLVRYDDAELAAIQSMGRKSLWELRNHLVACVGEGAPTTSAAVEFLPATSVSRASAPAVSRVGYRRRTSHVAALGYYLTMIEESGAAHTYAATHLDDVQAVWCSSDRQDVMGILHVGSEPIGIARHVPDRSALGHISLTPAAAAVLSDGRAVAAHSYYRIGALRLHRWMVDWNRNGGSVDDLMWSRKSVGWVEKLRVEAPDLAASLFEAGIFEDEEYLAHERSLDRETRTLVGRYRFHAAGGDSPEAHFSDVLRALPPWVLERDIGELPLTHRLSTTLPENGIVKVADLRRWSETALLEIKNFGRKSVTDLRDALQAGIGLGAPVVATEGDPESAVHADATSHGPQGVAFMDQFLASLDLLTERRRMVLQARMGWMRPSATLEEVAGDLGVSRERVRQLEASALRDLRQRSSWPARLADILMAQASQRPVAFDVLQERPWFAGAHDLRSCLGYLIRTFLDGKVHWYALEPGAEPVFVRAPKEVWGSMRREADRILAASLHQTREACEKAVRAIASDYPELAQELWEASSLQCRFVLFDDKEVLIYVGSGIAAALAEIMAVVPEPLHYAEIAAVVEQDYGFVAEPESVRKILEDTAVQLGTGIYGRDDHVAIPSGDRAAIVALAEEIVGQNPARQWHVQEILELILETMPDLALDPFVLDWLLGSSAALVDKGRMTWAPLGLGEQPRMEIRAAVVEALVDAGEPLFAAEIRAMVDELRGATKNFQVVPRSPIVRLGPQLFGLRDRDIGIPMDRQKHVLDLMATTLESRGSAIGMDEWSEVPGLRRYSGEDLHALSSLDKRFRVRGNRLNLAEWPSARRRRAASG